MASAAVVTNNGKVIALNRIFKSSPDYTVPSLFSVGIGTATAVVGDTALGTPVPITGTEAVDSADATTGWTAGTDSAVALNTTTFTEGTGSLSIAKSGTSGTVFSISKTTTSRDFTSKTLNSKLYITALSDLVASGTAVTIRFGSDSSNYYSYNVNLSVLTTGWNTIQFTSATATGTTGSPSITACDYYAILLNTDLAADTVAANRVLLDDLNVASVDDYYKAIASGYPVLDEATLNSTIRSVLLTTEANGASITEFGLSNSDGTKKLFSRSTFTGITKNLSTQIVYVEKDRVS